MLDVNVVSITQVKKLYGVNLVDLLLGKNDVTEKLSDIEMLVNVVFLLCEEQTQRLGITGDEFARSLRLDDIDAAWEALLQAVINFSRRGVQPALQKVLDKTRRLRQLQESKAIEEANNPEFDRMLDETLEKSLRSITEPQIDS